MSTTIDNLNTVHDNIPGRVNKVRTRALAVSLLIAIVLYALAISPRYKPTPDSAEYLGFAQSLAHNQSYTFNGRHNSCYPPLLSLIGAGVIQLADRVASPDMATPILKAILIVAAIIFVVNTRKLASQYLPVTQSAIISILILTNITAFQHCQYIISDMLFVALVMAAIIAADKASWGRWLIASVLLGLACLARSAGLFIVMGFALAILFGKWDSLKLRQRIARLAVMLPIALAGFAYWRLRFGSNDDNYIARWRYLTGKSSLIEIIWDRFVSQLSVVPLRSTQITLNIENIALPRSFVITIFLLILLGWAIQFWRRQSLPEWLTLSYMGIMSIWFDQGPRFFLPMLPFFLIYLLTAINWLIDRFSQPGYRAGLGRVIGLVIACVLAAPLAFYCVEHHRLPGLMPMLREGYIYSVLAMLLGISLIIKIKKIATLSALRFLIYATYIGIGALYIGGYIMLEHGLVRSRGPMLEGYMPYYQMGAWLKDQPAATEPVLCANASVVHLAGGKITAQPSILTAEKILSNLNAGQYGCLAIITQTDQNTPPDPENTLLQNLITEHPDQFSLTQTHTTDPHHQYSLYHHKNSR